MADRDDTNSGVAFPAHSDQSLMAQGRLNIEGKDHKIVVVLEKLKRDGPLTRVAYLRMGPLFENTEAKAKNDKAPDFSGPMDTHPHLRVAVWRGEKDGKKYLSFRVSKKSRDDEGNGGTPDGWDNPPASGGSAQASQSRPSQSIDDDEIPF